MENNLLNYLIDKCRTKNIYRPKEKGFIKKIKYFFSRRKKYLFNYKNFSDFNFGIPKEFIRLDPVELIYLEKISSQSKHAIVEVGRFFGGSTVVFNLSNSNVPIYSIDLSPQDDDFLNQILVKINHKHNTNLIIGDSQQKEYPEIKKYDFLFIDGDHSYDGCLADLKNWWNKLMPNGNLLLHDCYKTDQNGVQDAIKDFIAEKKNEIEIINFPFDVTKWKSLRTSFGTICHLKKK